MNERQRWEERHDRAATRSVPSDFVERHARRVAEARPGCRALDLACGTGRHSRLLAELGFHVVALDFARAALARARSEGRRIRPVQADASALPFARGSFELIVKTRFLDRTIFSRLAELLSPGGVLVAETFLLAQYEETGHPRPEFCLEPGELERLCVDPGVGLEPVDRHEGVYDRTHLAGIAARLP